MTQYIQTSTIIRFKVIKPIEICTDTFYKKGVLVKGFLAYNEHCCQNLLTVDLTNWLIHRGMNSDRLAV